MRPIPPRGLVAQEGGRSITLYWGLSDTPNSVYKPYFHVGEGENSGP